MMWFARTTRGREDYGTWIPTGLATLADAKFYMATYYNEAKVIEWLRM